MKISGTDRRDFIKTSAGAGLYLATAGFAGALTSCSSKHPVRIGFVGIGGRGMVMLKVALSIDGVEIPAVCDIVPGKVERTTIKNMNRGKIVHIGLLITFLWGCQSAVNNKTEVESKSPTMNVIELMKKQILLDSSKILYDKPVTPEEFATNWTVHHSEWKVKEGWLVGGNRGNWPGMAILKQDFRGNVLVEFEAQTILPSSHDINVMWNGEWLADTDQRGIAYVAGLQGWWTGKVGIEKSNDYKFMVGTPLLNFVPGKIYKIQAGSIDGHCFILADGKLLLEAMDPDPVDNQQYTKVGFEAYSSRIEIRNIKIRQINWKPIEMKYHAEF